MCVTTANNATPANGIRLVVDKYACPKQSVQGPQPGGDLALWNWYQFKNMDGSEDGEIMYNKASAPIGMYVHPDGGRAKADNTELVFWGAWDVGRDIRMLSLPSYTPPMNNLDLDPRMPKSCIEEHAKGIGCGWTLQYNCPGQPAGSKGRATANMASKNYVCCCVHELWNYRYRAWASTDNGQRKPQIGR